MSKSKILTPTPEQIVKERHKAGITQTQAANLIYKNIRTWQQWEKGDRAMDPAFFELFTIKIKEITDRDGFADITPADGNIFLDLGFEPEEAARLLEEADRLIDEKRAKAAAKKKSKKIVTNTVS